MLKINYEFQVEKSQLIAILRVLDAKELKILKKWLHSPIHNQREDVVALFEYLTSGNHLAEAKFLYKERVFPKIFGRSAPYDDAKIRQTIHFLQKAVEKFLVFEELTADEIRNKIALAISFRQRNLDKVFQRTLSGLEESRETTGQRTDSFFRNEYLIEQEKYNFMADRQPAAKLNLQAVADALDKTFIIEKLKLSCRMIFHQALYKANYEISFLEDILEFIENKDLIKEPAIGVYYYILKAITEQQDDRRYFEQLRSLVQSSIRVFPPSELREIYLMGINYCIKKINAADEAYKRETFEWYKQGLESKILLENNQVTQKTYFNAVAAALLVKEFNWADRFIAGYKKWLPADQRENLSHFCRSKLLFEKKDYKSAMRLLAQVEYDDILLNLNAKSMLVKMLYEQEELDSLDSLLESVRTFIQRKKVIGYHKNIYSNLVKYTRKLVRVNPYSAEQKEKLRQEILAANPLAERQWLLEQLGQL